MKDIFIEHYTRYAYINKNSKGFYVCLTDRKAHLGGSYAGLLTLAEATSIAHRFVIDGEPYIVDEKIGIRLTPPDFPDSWEGCVSGGSSGGSAVTSGVQEVQEVQRWLGTEIANSAVGTEIANAEKILLFSTPLEWTFTLLSK